jgi:uncharacterized protein
MRPLAILILSDRRPGHYHLAEGVAAAIARRRPVAITRIDVTRRRWTPSRLLAAGLMAGLAPGAVLRAGYGMAPGDLPPADLVVSAGGDTLAANVATRRLRGAASIYCGTLRHLPPEAVDVVVTSYARHGGLPRHLVALKPTGLDPDTLPPRGLQGIPGPDRPPRLAGLLVGGDSGLFRYRDDEWQRIVSFLAESHAAHGTRWIVSTSRRTPPAVADRLALMAATANGPICELIDFRRAGPGTLPRLFARVEAVLATEDSSTMLSEAVCARLPVVGIFPASHAFKDEEREYRRYLAREAWIASVAIAALAPERFLAALADVRPLVANPLDRLADALAERLPDLIGAPAR